MENYDPVAQLEQVEKMKYLRVFWDFYMEGQKESLNNPLTTEQLERNLELLEQGKTRFADEACWSDETIKYCRKFEDDLFEDPFDDWERDEEND